MFRQCETLAELNAQRKKLITEGVSQMEVNSAYNKAREQLMENATCTYKRIPQYMAVEEPRHPVMAMPMRVVGGSKNTIVITEQGVIL